MTDKYCIDAEGWGPVSPIRDFDLTPCFEEGILQSTLLVVLLAFGMFRTYSLTRLEDRKRSGKSRWLLNTKIVRFATSCFY